jgi:signal transduction histidine kinase
LIGVIVDALGFLTGAALYLMLGVMVWRERVSEGTSLLSPRGRLPLLTGLAGVIWNVGALVAFSAPAVGTGAPLPVLSAIAFGALGFLPATVVHSLVEGREASGRLAVRVVVPFVYVLSACAAVLHVVAAMDGAAVPSRPALWLLTGGFSLVTVALVAVMREQARVRRGLWVTALAIFAVSAWHFGRHGATESWWVELAGHHASLLLALAILQQDYRFALADLFLKNAIALLLLMGVSLALFSSAVIPLLGWADAGGQRDPRAIALVVGVWMATALVFPLLKRWAGTFVDRIVLKRPDYDAALAALEHDLERAESEDAALARLRLALSSTFGADATIVNVEIPGDRPVVLASALRAVLDPTPAAVLRLLTVDAPRHGIAIGQLSAGRRLLSDDVRLLEFAARAGARRLDALRVAGERLDRDVREQRIERLASEAELRALRAQLHPHFLFNALTTIGYLIQTSPARALDTLLRLTNVLRGVLRRTTTEFSTIGEEIDFIQSYLEIEQARFEERLRVDIDVPPALRSAACPALILQPLVENAVKHGLAPQIAGGRVAVRVRAADGRLDVEISDTGAGFDAGAVMPSHGVGLTSVSQRLRAHYGDAGVLAISSTPGGGTVAVVSVPLRRPDHVDRHQRKAG